MENHEEKQSNDGVEDKITTFASPAVLAAILDEDAVHGMVDTNEQGRDSERIDESLESSLNDSLESTKLRELGDLERLNTSESSKPLELSDQVSDFPKSSTPYLQTSDESNVRKLDKAPKPRRPQHIIERNKERIGERTPAKASYAQMHAIKKRNNLQKIEDKKQGKKSPENAPGSSLGNQSEHLEETLDQNSYFQGHVGQIHHDLGPVDHEQESDFLQDDSSLNGSFNTYQQHGPYYDVSQNSSLNYNEASYLYQPASYGRGYQSAMANLRQSHAMAGPVPPLHYNPLSTQSAPPGVYGYHRKPLISNIRSLHEEDYNLSSALPNTDFVHSDRGNKIPVSSLHRKFSSEPYLVQSSSPSLQKITNVGRYSKASGSYSSLRQPFQYKPYTLKEYRNFTGAEGEHLAGGLGPNVDTDDFKEKVKILFLSIYNF